MDRRAVEYLARRLENYDRSSRQEHEDVESTDVENRRRRRSDGTFMKGESEPIVGDEPRRRHENAHYDNESRRRIGFSQGKSEPKSHWSEEEFVGDMEESLYHEVDDIFHYVEIMTKVYHKGYDELASAFYEIASEKLICAEFLRGQLKRIGRYNATEHEKLEEDLMEARKMFKNV